MIIILEKINLETKINLLHSITLNQANQISLLSAQLGYKIDAIKTLNQIEKIIASRDNCIFIAVQNQAILGWIHAFYTIRIETVPFVEIAGLIVHENYRKQKIGYHLIEAVKEWTLPYNCAQISVRCNEIRTESHRFYENLGFILKKKQFIFERAVQG